MNETKRGQVITFYSYKGGSGRTMALANVATLLSEKNKVLAIDWDLEAPGLHYFFRNKIIKTGLEKPGLINLFEEIRILLEHHSEWTSEASDNALFSSLRLKDYLYNVVENKLFLLTAGRLKEGYPLQVATFQWETLFYRAPWLFRSFARYLTDQYDYVLIDSRTGLNDISGICTALMPDKLVAVFTPSLQSMDGIVSAVRSALHYRKESDDLRPLNIFPLPSRLELAEKELFDNWRFGPIDAAAEGYQPLFEKLLKESYSLESCDLVNYFENIQIQQVPYYAYGEKIAVSETQGAGRLSLSASYSLFTDIITNSIAPWTVQSLQPKLSSDSEAAIVEQVSNNRKRQIDAVRIQLRSQRASDKLKGMQKVRQWLQENLEDREIYLLLLDATEENPDLRTEVHELFNEMIQKGSKIADEALSSLPTLEKLLTEADDAYYAAEFEKAVKLYRQILRLDPENAIAKDHFAKARFELQVAQDLDAGLPRIAVQHYRRARSYIAARDFSTAVKELGAAIEAAEARGKKFADAEQLLNNVQDASIADDFKKRAHLALEKEEWKDALDLYNKALILDPTDEVIQKELNSVQSLLFAEAELRRRGMLKVFMPLGQLRNTLETARKVVKPDSRLLNFVERQINQLRLIRIVGILVLLFLIGILLKSLSPNLMFTPTLTTTAAITFTPVNISTQVIILELTIPPTTILPTKLPTNTPTMSPLGMGFITLSSISAWDMPNGKFVERLDLYQVVTRLEQIEDHGAIWFRCTWENNGAVHEGWILAEYIQFGSPPTS